MNNRSDGRIAIINQSLYRETGDRPLSLCDTHSICPIANLLG
ncbi:MULTISPECIES: hypothetical protein [unclassified Leptolyngbya]|nr:MULTISPECIES: hypothetical protein [unclassified Leptolyngbya]